MSWIPVTFSNWDGFGDGAAAVWPNAQHFSDPYQYDQYWWTGTTKHRSIMWNNAAAIYLIINKCNAMQAQIDAMGVTGMDAILTAMLGATFDQLQKFIGIEDAYRVALWNAPFNADFYAALARGFMKWP